MTEKKKILLQRVNNLQNIDSLQRDLSTVIDSDFAPRGNYSPFFHEEDCQHQNVSYRKIKRTVVWETV